MSLINEINPTGEQHEEWRVENKAGDDISESEYEDIEDEEVLDSDMEGSIIHRPRPKKKIAKVPAVAKKDDRRTSKILNDVILELHSLDGSLSKDTQQSYISENPQELYLSSEEASSISDYEDSLVDDTSASEDVVEEVIHTKPKRSSQEAKAVQLTIVSKPRVVEIHTRSLSAPVSRNISPATPGRERVSFDYSTLATAVSIPRTASRPSPLRVNHRTSVRRISISSTASTYSQESTASRPHSRHHDTPSTNSSPPRRSNLYALNTKTMPPTTSHTTQSAHPAPYSPIPESPHPTSIPYTSTSPPPSQSYFNESKTPLTPSKRRNFFSALTSSRKPALPRLSSSFQYNLTGASASTTGFGSRDGPASAHPSLYNPGLAPMSSIDLTHHSSDPFTTIESTLSTRPKSGNMMRMSALGTSHPSYPPPLPPQYQNKSNRTSSSSLPKPPFSRSVTVPSFQSLPSLPNREDIFEAGPRYSDEDMLAEKDIVRYEDIAGVDGVLASGKRGVRHEEVESGVEGMRVGEPVALCAPEEGRKGKEKGGLGSVFKGRWRSRN